MTNTMRGGNIPAFRFLTRKNPIAAGKNCPAKRRLAVQESEQQNDTV